MNDQVTVIDPQGDGEELRKALADYLREHGRGNAVVLEDLCLGCTPTSCSGVTELSGGCIDAGKPSMSTTNIIKIKLEQGGFGGLYVPGECGCLKEDLAPCGSCDPDDAGWINGCEPGYRHDDPRPGHVGEWAIAGSKLSMTAEDFDAMGV